MNLTRNDIIFLQEIGFQAEDMEQIDIAIDYTILTLEDDTQISVKKACDILGREEFLSGIGRSAFHYTSVRFGKDETAIYFDTSEMFKVMG